MLQTDICSWVSAAPFPTKTPTRARALLGSRPAMADVQPLRALHYDLSVVRTLGDVVAPPYDVIDAAQRAALIGRSPFNVVAVDLPRTPAAGKGGADGQESLESERADPYRAAGELFESWQLQGAVVRDSEPAVWAHTQRYTGPDGVEQTRRGFFCRVRIEEYGPGRVRPHERTHPGPKEDRLRLTRATRANMSPIFSLYSDPAGAAWEALAPATAEAPWGRRPTRRAPSTACGGSRTSGWSLRCRGPRATPSC